MVNPGDIPKFAPIAAVSNVKGNPGEQGSHGDYVYYALGMKVTHTMMVLEVDRPPRIVYEMSGGFTGTWIYALELQGNSTRVDTAVDYTARGGVIGKIADRLLLRRMNQRNLVRGVEGLKTYYEA